MVAEPHLPGREFGAWLYASWKQFEVRRDGDRFYENDPALKLKKDSAGANLACQKALQTVNDADDIQANVFVGSPVVKIGA